MVEMSFINVCLFFHDKCCVLTCPYPALSDSHPACFPGPEVSSINLGLGPHNQVQLCTVWLCTCLVMYNIYRVAKSCTALYRVAKSCTSMYNVVYHCTPQEPLDPTAPSPGQEESLQKVQESNNNNQSEPESSCEEVTPPKNQVKQIC